MQQPLDRMLPAHERLDAGDGSHRPARGPDRPAGRPSAGSAGRARRARAPCAARRSGPAAAGRSSPGSPARPAPEARPPWPAAAPLRRGAAAAGRRVPCSGETATPTAPLPSSARPETWTGSSSAWRTVLAIVQRHRSTSSTPGSSMLNSSLPSRATVAPGRCLRHHPPPHLDQHLVAAGGAERVVDLPEAVEVDDQHRRRPGQQHLGQPLGQQPAVGQPGERVVGGVVDRALEQPVVLQRRTDVGGERLRRAGRRRHRRLRCRRAGRVPRACPSAGRRPAGAPSRCRARPARQAADRRCRAG